MSRWGAWGDKSAYLREFLQRLAGIDELLFALIAANLLSLLSDIGGHLLDDGDTLRLGFLKALRQLEQISAPLPHRTLNDIRQRVYEL